MIQMDTSTMANIRRSSVFVTGEGVKASPPLQDQKNESPGEFPRRGFSYAPIFLRQCTSLLGVSRNSAKSVELLIFVTTHGSGPSAAVGCCGIGRPTGVGPKAME